MDLEHITLVHVLYRKGILSDTDVKRLKASRALVKDLEKKGIFERAEYDGSKGNIAHVAKIILDILQIFEVDSTVSIKEMLKEKLGDLLQPNEIDALSTYLAQEM